MKILIIKVSALGDVIHALPVLSYLKSSSVDLSIDWLVEEPFAPLLLDHPMVDRVITIKTKAWRRHPFSASTMRELWKLLDLGRLGPYDATLDLQGNCKSGLMSLLSRAPRRFGFSRDNVREWPNLLFTNRKATVPKESHHITERALSVAKEAIPDECPPLSAGSLFVRRRASEHVDKAWDHHRLSGRTVAVFHCGASWITKSWHLDCWKELAALVSDRLKMQVLMTWGNEDELAVCRQIFESRPETTRIWPKSSLEEVMALLAKADLVVGGDTGLIHMAAALETPTVSLFFVTDGARNAPRGKNHLCLQSSMKCSPCLKRKCEHAETCTRSIDVESVYAAIEQVMNRHQ